MFPGNKNILRPETLACSVGVCVGTRRILKILVISSVPEVTVMLCMYCINHHISLEGFSSESFEVTDCTRSKQCAQL